MKTGIKLERGGSVRHRLSLRLNTNRSEVLTLKNLSGRAAFREPRDARLLVAVPPFSRALRPCAISRDYAVSLAFKARPNESSPHCKLQSLKIQFVAHLNAKKRLRGPVFAVR
jgi:hypothetical protein